MQMKKYCLILGFCCGLSACVGDESSTFTPSTAIEAKLAFIGGDSSYFWTSVRRGMTVAATELDLEVTWSFPGPEGATSQMSLMRQFRDDTVDAMALMPLDPSGQTSLIAEITGGGIPVVTLEADAPASGRFAHLGTDPALAGTTLADELSVTEADSGKVAVFVGDKTVWGVSGRLQAFLTEAAAKGMSVVAVKEDGDDPALARQNVRDVLDTYADLAALVGISLHNAPAIAEVLAESGRTREVVVAGYDYEKLTLDYIVLGRIDFCVTPRPYDIGYLAVNILYDVLSLGEEEALKLIQEDRNIFPGVYVVTGNTVANFISYLNDIGTSPL